MTFNRLCELVLERSGTFSYSCLMLDLGFLYPEIKLIQDKIKEEHIYDLGGHGKELESHITCKYGLISRAANEVIPNLSLKPVKFVLTGLSLFENEEYDVLKFSVKSKDLITLNKEICDKFVCEDKFPVYSPHCCVCYVKPGHGSKYTSLKSPIIGKEYTSNKFIFSSSDGSKVWHTV